MYRLLCSDETSRLYFVGDCVVSISAQTPKKDGRSASRARTYETRHYTRRTTAGCSGNGRSASSPTTAIMERMVSY